MKHATWTPPQYYVETGRHIGQICEAWFADDVSDEAIKHFVATVYMGWYGHEVTVTHENPK